MNGRPSQRTRSRGGAWPQCAAVWLLLVVVAAFGASRVAAQNADEEFAAESNDTASNDTAAEDTGGVDAASDGANGGSTFTGSNEGDNFVASEAAQPKPSRTPLEEPVEAGRNALDRWVGYPWYDRKADDLRPIKLPTPSSSTGSWNLEWIKWAAWGALAVCLLLLAYYVMRAYLERERRGAKTSTAAGRVAIERAGLESLPFEVRRPRASLLEEARRHYEAGDYAEAIIYLFSHRLVELDQHQVIRLTKGKTNRQYLRETGASSPVARILDQTMGHFEAVFFGKHPLARADFEACWNEQAAFDQFLVQPVAAAS